MSIILTAELAYQHYLQKVHYNPEVYDEKRDKLVIRASNGGRCHLLQKFHLSPDHKPKKLKPEDMAVFRIGTVFHEEIQSAFKWIIDVKNKDKSHIRLDMEGKIKLNLHGLDIEGHYDIRIFDDKNKHVQIIDIKTMNPRAMSYFKKDPMSKITTLIQLGVYAMATKKEYPDYDVSILLSAWDKDKGGFFEVEIPYSKVVFMADDYYRNLAETLKLDIENIIPIQNRFAPMDAKWECNYCSYNHICTSPRIKKI